MLKTSLARMFKLLAPGLLSIPAPPALPSQVETVWPFCRSCTRLFVKVTLLPLVLLNRALPQVVEPSVISNPSITTHDAATVQHSPQMPSPLEITTLAVPLPSTEVNVMGDPEVPLWEIVKGETL